jgi:ribonucleotide monophosphatase NagD (HAD superfamily)
MSYFEKHPETGVTHPSQIVVIGDRLTTDVMLANTMGAYSIFISDGVMGRDKLTLVRFNHSRKAYKLTLYHSSWREWSKALPDF